MTDALDIDISQFSEAVRGIHEATNRELPVIINMMAKDVAFTAIQLTKAARAESIENVVNLRSVPWTDPGTGKTHSAPLWCLYVASRLRTRSGITKGAVRRVFREQHKLMKLSGIKGKPFTSAYYQGKGYVGREGASFAFEGITWTRNQARILSRSIINIRKRAINFIRAGFIPAARIFAAAVPSSSGGYRDDYRVFGYQFGVSKGGATIAREGPNPVAEIWNTASGNDRFSRTKTGGAALVHYGGQGLQGAVNKVASREMAWAEERMARVLRQFSAS